ncbi:MAG: hypothetical protein B6D61_15010 [Bacteroidetes bacterium 4484_249]|nr:MAG: hypothetical protein B6D61_15010 [Bacteroidetes bacterium 4484_249]
MTEKSIKKIHLDNIWLKAAVIGGLWASVEIIIGSFFHNLRIPFAGSILAANGTILIIAFYQMWPEKGLIWRAGLICALMKSISPSAIILGPMIGILSEAIIIEIAIRLFGNNLISLSIGGALSVSSAFLHKVVSLIILYGLNLVKLYVDIFHFAAKQVRIENANPWILVFIIIAVYLFLGTVSAFTGYYIGKKSKETKHKKQGYKLKELKTNNILLLSKEQKFYVPLFLTHLILIPMGLILINYFSIVYGTIFIFLYSVFCIYRYKKSLRRLRKPIFWIQLFILTFLAAIFWNGFNSSGSFFDTEGLLIGFEMNIRAIFVVIAFSSFGVELRNPVIRDYLFKKGFSKIYMALGLSFAALPVMIEAMPRPKYFLRHPANSFSDMMVYAREWLVVFETTSGRTGILNKE